MMDKPELMKALDYFEMWVEHDESYENNDDLSRYRRTARDAIKECIERREAVCKTD